MSDSVFSSCVYSSPDPSVMWLVQRLTRAMRPAVIHLLGSAAVATLASLFVFGWWFPSPFRGLMGGAELFWLIVGVDVVCGPLLTLVVFNPSKPRTELRRDLALVVVIQLFALGYGVYTLSHSRPLALVHEVDRFRAVSYSDLDEADVKHLPPWTNPWGLSGPRTLGIRAAATPKEKLASFEASLQGIEPSQRPSWWQDYALSAPQVLERAKPISALRDKHPAQAALLDAAIATAVADAQAHETKDPAALRWLPLVSRRATDWVVLIDPATARVRGYAHLDGF